MERRIRYGQRKNNQFLGCVHLYYIYVQQCVLLVSAPLQADLTRDDNTPSVRSSAERFTALHTHYLGVQRILLLCHVDQEKMTKRAL